MSDNVEKKGKNERVIAPLALNNWATWAKNFKHKGTRLRDANTELHSGVMTVYRVPRQTENVDEEKEDDDGVVTVTRRAWSTAKDQNGLNARTTTYLKDVETLKNCRAEMWTLLVEHCTNAVINAVESDVTYTDVQQNVNSLGLYLLMRKACLKHNRNNVEAERTRWFKLKYIKNEDIYAFMNTFEEIVANIRMAANDDSVVRDCDMVFRLRDALPLQLAKDTIKETFVVPQDSPEYPKFPWCKERVTTYVSAEMQMEGSDGGHALAVQPRRGPRPPGPPSKSGTHTGTKTDTCYNCGEKGHFKRDRSPLRSARPATCPTTRPRTAGSIRTTRTASRICPHRLPAPSASRREDRLTDQRRHPEPTLPTPSHASTRGPEPRSRRQRSRRPPRTRRSTRWR
jgi:hypothetical protein